jgi:hypothetical protein
MFAFISLLLALNAGMVNYVQGKVAIDGVPVTPGQVGSVGIAAGHVIQTEEGMAEVLLGPGSILRLGNRSELRLESSGPQLRVTLSKGEATLEVIEPSRQGSVITMANGKTTVIQEPGLYFFSNKHVPKRKSGELHEWTKVRAAQLRAESEASAQTYAAHGPAWYWDPLFGSYEFIPGHTHNVIPKYRGGDSYLYGPPVIGKGGQNNSPAPNAVTTVPTVPLTAPGEPSFPNSRRP